MISSLPSANKVSLSQIIIRSNGNRFTVLDGETVIFSGFKSIPQHRVFLENVAETISVAALAA